MPSEHSDRNGSSKLWRLAELCGIERGYDDIYGRRHETSETTLRALLGAMGVDDFSSQAVATAIAEREQRLWQNPLPPVHVFALDAPRPIGIRSPVGMMGGSVQYLLTTEDGSERRGTLDLGGLPLGERVDRDGRAFERREWMLPTLPLGYHRLEICIAGKESVASVIVTPSHCYLPEALRGDGRVWGPALQLFGLRSRRNYGIGDFTDLSECLAVFADGGAGIVGLSPVQSLYLHDPENASPYGPSSRRFLNPLYIDVSAAPNFNASSAVQEKLADPAFRARVAAARDSEFVDYSSVAAIKLELLECLFAHFERAESAPHSELGRDFEAFLAGGGEPLRLHALYEALAQHFRSSSAGCWGWPVWPAGYEHPMTTEVRQFAAEAATRVRFYGWLQWLADRQLDAAARRAAALALGVGLYLDLPLGDGLGGSEVWANPDLYARDTGTGSPPDEFNPHGQNWGLPPWIPERLAAAAYRPFIELLQRNMRHAGALRLDHVMGLMRLFWIPNGRSPHEGAYVRYPMEDLLGIVALESHRNACVVVGEDLGTVPGELRAAIAARGVLSNRVFYFEKAGDGGLKPPQELPRQALVSVSNHDLPPLRSFWTGEDIVLRQRLGLYRDNDHRDAEVVERAQARAQVLVALSREQLLPDDIDEDPARVPDLDTNVMVAIHRYLARSHSMIFAFQIEDAFGLTSQINLPGTTDEHPNWRQKLPVGIEQWSTDPRFVALLTALGVERGSAAGREQPSGVAAPLCVPRATYRLQLHRDFNFAAVSKIVPYLARLGVSHAYFSPYLKARPGSRHGYDVIDHNEINAEIGTRADLESLCVTLRRAGLGQIVDVVPNHMGVMGSDSRWWLDVLENGQASAYAHYFDIDWSPVRSELHDKVLLPVLGDHYGKVLERGELVLTFEPAHGSFAVHYFEHTFPLDPATYADILGFEVQSLSELLGGNDSLDYAEYLSIVRAFAQLPPHRETDLERRAERLREKEVAKRRLSALCDRNSAARQVVENQVARVAGTPERPESYARLHELLEQQAWRVAYWQVAADEINYRRFFDINELAALRTENTELLRVTHALLADLHGQGLVDGLRIDHPDGLYDPAAYFAALQQLICGRPLESAAEPAASHCYVIAEKILAAHEYLREDWAVHGTTGYDFAYLVNGLTVYAATEAEFDRCYRTFTEDTVPFDDLLYRCKTLIIRAYLSSELTTLANLLNQIAQSRIHTRDFTLNGIRDALTEVVACFPVYRTYVTPCGVDFEDRRYVDWAVSWARSRDARTHPDVYEFIRTQLLLELPEPLTDEMRARSERFAMKFQQYTAPVMAKALEDTCFYRYVRLASLCEVGGDPSRFGVSIAAFHHQNRARQRRWPHGLLAGSTHDNKRSEDVRARINVLSEIPADWSTRIRYWRDLTRSFRRSVDVKLEAPTPRDEYLYYQTIVGAWPLTKPDAESLEAFANRLVDYMTKAAREAKEHTSWMRPNVAYEDALEQFIRASLLGTDHRFRNDVAQFVRELAPYGLLNSLTQACLRLTAPGVPDIYQGNELWDYSLVDPDNRRPVDYETRAALLEQMIGEASAKPDCRQYVTALMDQLIDGRIKLYLIWRLLRLRAEQTRLFENGDYLPLTTSGVHAEHVCAFVRQEGEGVAIVVAGRWFRRLRADRVKGPNDALLGPELWDDTAVEGLPHRVLHNVLTGEPIDGTQGRVSIARLLSPLPVAVLLAGAPERPEDGARGLEL